MPTITPKILTGTRDFLPNEMASRLATLDKIRSVFKKFGYAAVETPTLQDANILVKTNNTDATHLTYRFTTVDRKTAVTLPFDHTVPLARFVASHWKSLPMPFKAYQISRVWRAEKPQRGRLREFYQCDIDIVGSKSLICEAEMLRVIVDVFNELNITQYKIKINSRRLLNAILNGMNVSQAIIPKVIRCIDKLEKIGNEKIIAELKNLGIEQSEDLLALLMPAENNTLTLKKLKSFDLEEIEELFFLCKQLNVPEDKIQFDSTLARGLDYYTGIIFEVVSESVDFGTLCAGGRYDDLCNLFQTKKQFSGVGIAFGFERIMLLLDILKQTSTTSLNASVLITYFDKASINASLLAYNDLLEAGISSEIYVEPEKLSKQFKFADKKNIPFVVMLGPEELENETVKIKVMKNGKQKILPRNQLISFLAGYYECT